MSVIDPTLHPMEEWRPGVLTRMQVSAATGTTAICMFEQWISPGSGARRHTHPVEEVLTVLSGEAELWLDNVWQTASAGRSLVIPAGREHGFRNTSSGILHLHAILAAPRFEASYEGQSEAVIRWDRETV